MYSIWPAVEDAEKRGDQSGSRFNIKTKAYTSGDCGVDFVVSVADGPWPKYESKSDDPFCPPYDPDLFVIDISTGGDYVVLLNKFCVAEHHLICVPKAFYSQIAWIRVSDFEAVCWVLDRFQPSVAFFNSGAISGASQPHHHFQIVALPLGKEEHGNRNATCPMENMVQTCLCTSNHNGSDSGIASLPLPFLNLVVAFDKLDHAMVARKYREMMSELDRRLESMGHLQKQQPGQQERNNPRFAYNIVMTNKWMLVVPRSAAEVGEIKVNGLGYCGSFLTRSEEAKAVLLSEGCMNILTKCGFGV